MTRLTLCLAVLLGGIMFIVSLPFLCLIWLLGGEDVFESYIDMLNTITTLYEK